MDAAHEIRESMQRVGELRAAQARNAGVYRAVRSVKALQARRFSGTYADLLRDPTYASPARFFLEELYSDRDFSSRDSQFARIAGAIDKLFPAPVVRTAVNLARLHVLTETFDHAMGIEWDARAGVEAPRRYVESWRAVGRREDRQVQLADVLALGDELARLTRTPGLRTMLRMMRSPASAAGLDALQRFLEAGFDTFGAMARTGHAAEFLRTVSSRESHLMDLLFDAPPVAGETELARTLGQAP
jgi:hypothetical protein